MGYVAIAGIVLVVLGALAVGYLALLAQEFKH